MGGASAFDAFRSSARGLILRRQPWGLGAVALLEPPSVEPRSPARASERYSEGQEFDSHREAASRLDSWPRWHRRGTNFQLGGTNGGLRKRFRGNAWRASETKKPAHRAGLSEAADGTRTHDLLHGKQTLGTANDAGNACKFD